MAWRYFVRLVVHSFDNRRQAISPKVARLTLLRIEVDSKISMNYDAQGVRKESFLM